MRRNRFTSRFLLHVSFLVVTLSFAAVTVCGQEENRTGTVGLTTSVQEGLFDIQVPIWVNERIVVAPSFGLINISDGFNDLRMGIFVRANLKKGKAVPYAGIRAGALIFDVYNNKNVESQTDVVAGLAFGGEYFLDDHFSFGVEAQLNVLFSDEFSLRLSNPDGRNLNTASVFQATFYF